MGIAQTNNSYNPVTNLPHDIVIEQALISTLIDQNSAIDDVAGWLTSEHFWEPLHGDLYELIVDLRSSAQSITIITIKPHLEALKEYDQELEGGAWGYLTRLAATSMMPASVAKDYARDIVRLSLRRRCIQDAEDFIKNAHLLPRDKNVVDLVGEMGAKLTSFMSELQGEDTTEFDANDVIREIIQRLEAGRPTDNPPITTGLHDFDKLTGGLRRNEFYLVAGRPSMGKSGFGISMAMKMARRGFGQYFISLEMTADRVFQRCLSELAYSRDHPIEYSRIDQWDVSETEISRLKDATARLTQELPFTVNQQAAPTVIDIEAACRRMKRAMERRGQSLDVVWIDYLGLIRPTSTYAGSKYAETTEVSNQLMAMAKRLGVAVVCLAQLSRQVEQRDEKRPRLSDLRDSGSLEQDADTILFVYRDEYYIEREKPGTFSSVENEADWDATMSSAKNKLELIAAKQRNGPTRTLSLFFDVASNFVGDLSE